MLKLDQIFGFVMNIPSECRLGFLWLPLKRRHWISIKKINGIYYNLDSKLSTPSQIGNVCYILLLLIILYFSNSGYIYFWYRRKIF